MKVTRHTLKNGIRAVIVEMPDRKVVATTVYVGAGGRYETPKTYGISHFLEHMLFRGTEKYQSGEELSRILESVGGQFRGATCPFWSRYCSIVPREHLTVGLDVLSQLIHKSLLRKEDIEKEKNVIAEEIHRAYDNPENFYNRLLRQLAWKGHPLESTVLGSKENINKFNREMLSGFLDKNYVSGNLIISVAGNVNPKKIIKELEDYFGEIKKGKKVIPKKFQDRQKDSQILLQRSNKEQANIVLAYKSFSYLDKRKYAMDLLMTLLAGGNGFVLQEEIRGKRGLAYALGGYSIYFHDTGISFIYAGVNKKNAYKTIKIIKKELYKTKDLLFYETNIQRAKEKIKGNYLMYLDHTLSVSYAYGLIEFLDPNKIEPKEYLKIIDRVTVEEIRAVANDVFQDKNENLVVIGPYKDKKKFEDALRNY